MPPVKRQVVDTSKTDPAAFLAASPGADVPSAPAQPAATQEPPLPDDGTKPEPPEVPIPEVTAPNRPGLEAPATPELAPTPDPFVLLNHWETATTKRTLRALAVPGGCIVRVSAAIPGNLSESICFVPNVKVENGQLVAV